MKKTLCLLLILILSIFSLCATESINSTLPSLDKYYVDILKNGTPLNGSTLDNGILHLIPKNTLIYNMAEKTSSSSNSFSVSITAFKTYNSSWNNLSENEKLLKIFNIVTAISTQKGIKYISRTSGNKEKVLMEDSYCISDLDKKKSPLQ